MGKKLLTNLVKALNKLDEAFLLRHKTKERGESEKEKPLKATLNKLDSFLADLLKSDMDDLERAYRWFVDVAVRGGTEIRPMRRTGTRLGDWFERVRYKLMLLAEDIDTKVLYDNRRFSSRAGRFRSIGEKKIAETLRDYGIRFRYEPKLTLEGITLHPDFYLPDHDVYIEFWGMENVNKSYRNKRRKKMELYQRNGIRVISIYPHQLRDLRRNLPRLYESVTGMKFPIPSISPDT